MRRKSSRSRRKNRKVDNSYKRRQQAKVMPTVNDTAWRRLIKVGKMFLSLVELQLE